MPCMIKGIEFPFTYRSATEIHPGSVPPIPDGGGLFDMYTCDKCGWRRLHQVFGTFQFGETERNYVDLIRDLEFHGSRCRGGPKCCICQSQLGPLLYYPKTEYSGEGWYCNKCKPGLV